MILNGVSFILFLSSYHVSQLSTSYCKVIFSYHNVMVLYGYTGRVRYERQGIYGFTKCKWLVISYVKLSELSENQDYYLLHLSGVGNILGSVHLCVCLSVCILQAEQLDLHTSRNTSTYIYMS